MTTWQQEIPYQKIASPLNVNEFDEYPDDAYNYDYVALANPAQQVQQRMLFILSAVLLLSLGFWLLIRPLHPDGTAVAANAVAANPEAVAAGEPQEQAAEGVPQANASGGGISPVFAPPVQHWAPQIVAWANAHGVDPNLAAIIMQIESCGDPNAVSSAGAQGLFQVMPFHFNNGENMQDPDTNAARGLAYFAARLVQTNGDIGRAFAGYNGGHVAAAKDWGSWAAETQRYYRWSTGILGDIEAGLSESPTLQQWMAAGGASLCNQAARRLGLQ